jgi:hypothetical protein
MDQGGPSESHIKLSLWHKNVSPAAWSRLMLEQLSLQTCASPAAPAAVHVRHPGYTPAHTLSAIVQAAQFKPAVCYHCYCCCCYCPCQSWSSQGVRGVWLKVPLQYSQLVPVAVQQGGFTYHHAEQVRPEMGVWVL